MSFKEVKYTLHKSVLEKIKSNKLKNQKNNVTDEKRMIKTSASISKNSY